LVSDIQAVALYALIICLVPNEEPKRQFDGTPTEGPPKVDIDYRLKLDISAELANDSTILVSWEKKQRREASDFCRRKYKWQLEVLTWEYSELFYDFNNIWNQSFIHNATKVQNTFVISAADCYNNAVHLNMNVSKTSYYKFQLRVSQDDNDTVKGSDSYGSYLHYFGSQSDFYSRHKDRITVVFLCRSAKHNISS